MKAPPLIALPGTLLDGRSLEALLQGLNSHMGLMGTMRTTPHIDDEVDRLARLAGAGAAVRLGHWLGGIVALHLALRHPSKVTGRVLLGANAPAGRDSSERGAARSGPWHSETAYRLWPTASWRPDMAWRRTMLRWRRWSHRRKPWDCRALPTNSPTRRQRPGLLAPRRPLAAPALTLSGEHDSLCPPEQSDEIVALVLPPHSGVHHRLAGAGHLFPMQQPRTAAEHLHTFLHHMTETCP